MANEFKGRKTVQIIAVIMLAFFCAELKISHLLIAFIIEVAWALWLFFGKGKSVRYFTLVLLATRTVGSAYALIKHFCNTALLSTFGLLYNAAYSAFAITAFILLLTNRHIKKFYE